MIPVMTRQSVSDPKPGDRMPGAEAAGALPGSRGRSHSVSDPASRRPLPCCPAVCSQIHTRAVTGKVTAGVTRDLLPGGHRSGHPI